MTTIAPVQFATRGARHELRAVKVVWYREILRFRTDRGRILSSFAQPLLFLFVLGKGLGASIPGNAFGDADYSTFLFPGVLATSVMFTAVFSAISIVWDRELGFLREMLVAPVSRTSSAKRAPRSGPICIRARGSAAVSSRSRRCTGVSRVWSRT